jgi:hypothetical protein
MAAKEILEKTTKRRQFVKEEKDAREFEARFQGVSA